MGNAAFTRVAVTLMPDDELNNIQANNSEVCGAAVCAKISALKPVHEYERKVTLHSNGTSFLCIKLGKTQQIQLKTLYMICKKKIAADAIALSAAAEDEMPLPSLTRIPVLAIYVQVKRGALKSAYLAVNRPFPDKNRHQWIWTPTDDKFRKLQSDHRKTLGHQRAEPPFPVLEVAAASGDPNAAAVASMASAKNPLKAQPLLDKELGTSGCVFDLTNQSTEFFKVGEYFLSLTAEDDAQISFPPEVPAGSYHGGTEVIVTAKITMRTLLPTAKSLLKVAQILTPEQKAEREAKAAKFHDMEAKRIKQEEEEAKARAERAKAMREEAEKQKAEAEAKKAAAEEERLAKIKAEKAAEAAAAAAAGPDPFADEASSDGAKRPTTAQNESKYDDPFEDKPAAVVAAAALGKDDPFASVGSTPVPSSRPGAKDLDVLDALDAAEPEEKANAIAAEAAARRAAEEEAAAEESSDDEDHPDVLANVSGMTTPKLSPDLLAQMDSARTTPQVAKSDINSLSLASTPLVKPVKADPRALDTLPDKPLKPVSLEQRPAVVVSPQELQVPLESLPATKSTPIRDVLAQEQTPRLEPRPADAPTLSRMPSPAVKPVQASAKVLDAIPVSQLGEKPVEKNTRVLDELPTPKLKPVAKDSRVLDSLAGPEVLPPMELPVQEAPESSHTVSNADVDAILGPPGSEKKKKKKAVQKPVSTLPPRVPIRQPSVAVRPTNPVSPQPAEPIAAPVYGVTLSPDTTPRNSISAAKVSSGSDKNPLDDLPDDPLSGSKQQQSPAIVAKSDRTPSLNPLDRDSPFASSPPTPQPQSQPSSLAAASKDPFDSLDDDSPPKPPTANNDKKDTALDDIFGDEDQAPPVPSYDPNLLDSL